MTEQKNETITKKAAAIEVIKARTKGKTTALIGIAAIFISLLFYIFSQAIGAAIAAIAVIILAVMLNTDTQEIRRLEATYSIKPTPTILNKITPPNQQKKV